MTYCVGSFNGWHPPSAITKEQFLASTKTGVLPRDVWPPEARSVLFGLSLCSECAERATSYIATRDAIYSPAIIYDYLYGETMTGLEQIAATRTQP
jgi:hypothetical protein